MNKNEAITIIQQAKAKQQQLATTPIMSIIDLLHRVGEVWHQASGHSYYQEAKQALVAAGDFSTETIELSLSLIPELLHRENLLTRVRSELANEQVLDQFHSHHHYSGRVRAFPLGTLLHVTAGNIFLGAIDSLLMGFLTKNVSIIKLSQKNNIFPYLFAESLRAIDSKAMLADKFFLCSWSRHDKETETIFKNEVDAIVAWGGEEMLQSYSSNLPLTCKLLNYGPKISFQAIFDLDLTSMQDKLFTAIAEDVALWDQSACASPQNLFLEMKDDSHLPIFMEKLADAIEKHPLPRGPLSPDEELEISKERQRAQVHTALLRQTMVVERPHCTVILDPSGPDISRVLAHHDQHLNLRPSPLNRTLIIKLIKNSDDLIARLTPMKKYLQTCGLHCPDSNKRDEITQQLGLLGIARITPIGRMLAVNNGAPHDGRFGLTELVRLVAEEPSCQSEELLNFVNRALTQVPFYQELALATLGKNKIERLDELPLINGKMLSEHPLSASHYLLNEKAASNGYIFSSGGTTGKPKYSFYTHHEFERVGELLGRAFLSLGLKKGDLAANCFAAGHMWSSFLAIEKALKFCEAIQLPMGMVSPEEASDLLQTFRPRAIFGLPSMLVSYADTLSRKKNLSSDFTVPYLFYAGEHLNTGARQFLQEVFHTKQIYSAGYASVDAGPIGYQCPHCLDTPGMHHLFADSIDLSVSAEGEGIITSKFRQSMPIIRYQSGDHITLSSQRCACGSSDPLFVLHGRIDGQVNMWGCKFGPKEIERAFAERLQLQIPNFQLILSERDHEEYLTILFENEKKDDSFRMLDLSAIAKALYESCSDVAKTHAFDYFAQRLTLTPLAIGEIPRVERTGKVRAIIDKRRH